MEQHTIPATLTLSNIPKQLRPLIELHIRIKDGEGQLINEFFCYSLAKAKRMLQQARYKNNAFKDGGYVCLNIGYYNTEETLTARTIVFPELWQFNEFKLYLRTASNYVRYQR